MRALDLFGSEPAAVRPRPTPARRQPVHTCRRETLVSNTIGKDGKPITADVFIHPCGLCGAAVAPFGSNASLLAAYRTGNAMAAGTWLCGACWEANRL